MFVLFREDSTWTATRFREKLGCPDALYQADGYGQVVRCLSLALAFSTDVLDVSNTSVKLEVEGMSVFVVDDDDDFALLDGLDGFGVFAHREKYAALADISLHYKKFSLNMKGCI